jgi:hypothetical protein
MTHEQPISGSDHPAPQRGRTDQTVLWLTVIAAPLAWAARLLINYSIAGQHCLGAADIGERALPHGRLTTILLIDLVAALIAAAAGYAARQRWLETQSEKGGGAHRLVHSGEGRTRFLAMCGMLTSALFGLAIIIDAIGAMIGPPC